MAFPSTTWQATEICNDAFDFLSLTQPIATVLAALIAVVAAGIAYAGVTKTVRSTRRQNRRKDKADALVDGLSSLQTMARMITQAGLISDPSSRLAQIQGAVAEKVNGAADAWTLANGRLLMYGMQDVLNAAEPFVQKAQLEWAAMVSAPGYEFKGAEILLASMRQCPHSRRP